MTKNGENVDEGEEALELQGSGGKEHAKNSTRRQRQRRPRLNRVRIIIVATVCCIILILLCAWFIFTSLSSGLPEWIETIPGIHHRPTSSDSDGSLIAIRSADASSYEAWTEVIDKVLSGGEYNATNKNLTQCSYSNPPEEGQLCRFDTNNFGPCTKERKFGYDKGSPCVFLRVGKIENWIPEFYNDSTNLPVNMPEALKDHIKVVERSVVEQLETLWVTCNGISPADEEMIGPLTYYPQWGFSNYYFPYDKSEDYMRPLVAVHFEKPSAGILFNVECRLWAPNLEYDREKGVGFVQFEMIID